MYRKSDHLPVGYSPNRLFLRLKPDAQLEEEDKKALERLTSPACDLALSPSPLMQRNF